MLAAALLLPLMFAFPIWKITLVVPQYPENLALNIWVNKITGDEPSDLQNINILNHYIGMKEIKPDSIPELKFMPYIVILMSVTALILFVLDKWKLNTSWLIIFIILGAAALIDFYLWEYDYGHDLNPDAAIKIEGLAYQPPFLGSKKILNFVSHSYPSLGSLFMFLSMLCGGIASWYGYKERNKLSAQID